MISNILFEPILLGISLISFFGILSIIYRKIPVLVDIPDRASLLGPQNFIKSLVKKIGSISFLKNFSFELFLHKMLSRLRILILRTDSKTSVWLHQLRERAKKKKMAEIDTYWQELRRLTTLRKKK